MHVVRETTDAKAQLSTLSFRGVSGVVERCEERCVGREWEIKTEVETEIAVRDFSGWILDAHLSRPWALTHNDLLVCSYFWRIVVHVQHLDGNRNVAEKAGVVCSREGTSDKEDESQM